MKKYYLPILFIVVVIIIIFACEVDHGLYPIDYKIKGEIIFFKGEAPENTDRIEVFALKEFPPDDPQNFLYLGRSGSLDYSKGDTVKYEVQVSPTSYQLIGVLWRETGKDWSLTGLIGIYTGDLLSIFPGSVVVSNENPVVDSVNFYANWDVVSKDANISGKITYNGDWPEDTSLLLLAVYKTKPNPANEFSYIAFENLDYSQPIHKDSSSYDIAVNSGTYNYVVLFWVGKNMSKLTDLTEIGKYEDPDNPGEAGTIIISENDSTQYDINVNFDNIEFP